MPRPNTAVWDHYIVLRKPDGKRHVTCSFCSAQYKHAMANRLKRHLLKCSKCPREVKQLLINNVPTILKSSPEGTVLPSTSPSSTMAPSVVALSAVIPSSSTSDPHDSHDTTFTTQPVSHNEINIALARAIYATGQPTSLLESEHWKQVFYLLDPSYTVPTKQALSKTLLDLEYKQVKDGIDIKLAKSLALALITDGWTNAIGNGVINCIVTTPEPIFYHAIYPEVNTKPSDCIGSQIVKIINEIGPAKFVVLVTDNSANMKAAWRIVKKEFSHISCIGCLSHSLDLIYKDIFKNIGFFKVTLDKILQVIKFIKHTDVALSQFEKYQAEKFGSNLCTLKLFSTTRWSEAYITVKSYKQNREALELLAKPHHVSHIMSVSSVTEEIKEIILDTTIWIKVNDIISILDPIATGLLLSEKDNALLSDVPFIFKELYQNISHKLEESVFLDADTKHVVLACIIKHEKMCLQPIHFAAHLLDPRYCDRNMLSDEEISQASEFIRNYCATIGIDETKPLLNMAEFYTKVNFFEPSKAIWAPAKELEPRLWWQTFAFKQSIGVIAAKILSLPPSTAAAARNFTLFSRTHTRIKMCKSEPQTSQSEKVCENLVAFIDRSEDDYDSCDNDSQSEYKVSNAIDPLEAVSP